MGGATAGTVQGRATLRAPADAAGLEVCGTTDLVYGAHYDEQGFREAWEFLRVAASKLRPMRECTALVGAARWPSTLELSALPVMPLESKAACARRIATARVARE